MNVSEARQRLADLMAQRAPAAQLFAEADAMLDLLDQDADLLDDIGVFASDADEYDRAIAYFEAALDLDPRPSFYYDLAVAQLRAERPALARPALERAVAAVPYFTHALANLAACYLLLDEWVAGFLVSDRVRALYAGQPLPDQVDALFSGFQRWLNAGGRRRPRGPAAKAWSQKKLTVAGLRYWDEGTFEGAHLAFSKVAAALSEQSPSEAIAAECAATAAFYLDRHHEYLDGSAQRREIVPCAQAIVPVVPNPLMEAGLQKDASAFCHRLVRRLDPELPQEDGPLMMKRKEIGPRGAIARTFMVAGTAGTYDIVPIGNIILVTTPSGERYEYTDYTGDHTALFTS